MKERLGEVIRVIKGRRGRTRSRKWRQPYIHNVCVCVWSTVCSTPLVSMRRLILKCSLWDQGQREGGTWPQTRILYQLEVHPHKRMITRITSMNTWLWKRTKWSVLSLWIGTERLDIIPRTGYNVSEVSLLSCSSPLTNWCWLKWQNQ